MRRLIALLLLACLLLTGCGAQSPDQKQYTATFLNLFDTVTQIVGRAESEEAFQQQAQQIHDKLLIYHQLFDIYHNYGGIANLKTINDQAGIAPVEVDPVILDLLEDCKEVWDLTGGRVNVALGSVLALWHDARTTGINDPQNARLPEESALTAAAAHTSMDFLVLDRATSTAYLSDPEALLDVGAIAKGWAVAKVAEDFPSGLLISVGGNVCATGPKDEAGTPWVIGVQDPDGASGEYLHTLYLTEGSVVTSGDYQRAYLVDGKAYHHIIDPDTLYPARLWRAVTVVCPDSSMADALSTALFLLPQADGQALLDRFGAQALWIDYDGQILYSPGFEAMIRT